MIRTSADVTTRDIWNGVNSKAARRIPRDLWTNVRRKLDQIDAVTRLDDLKVPPGNRVHALGADLRGFHAVRVNDQYRIVFRLKAETHSVHSARLQRRRDGGVRLPVTER